MNSKNSTPSEMSKKIWNQNLTDYEKTKKSRKNKIQGPIETLTRIPNEEQILNRYTSLASNYKSVNERCKLIAEECVNLWNIFNFPMIGKNSIVRKIDKLINKRNESLKRSGVDSSFNMLFDITKVNGEWLCSKDKTFYNLQIETGGKVGYTTLKQDDPSKVHPSKRIKYILVYYNILYLERNHIYPKKMIK